MGYALGVKGNREVRVQPAGEVKGGGKGGGESNSGVRDASAVQNSAYRQQRTEQQLY